MGFYLKVCKNTRSQETIIGPRICRHSNDEGDGDDDNDDADGDG